MNIRCPTCGSENTQSVVLAYQSGVSTGTARSTGYAFGGKGGFFSAITRSSSSTALADRVGPPFKLPYILRTVGAVLLLPYAFGLLKQVLTFGFFTHPGAFIFQLVLAALFGYLCYSVATRFSSQSKGASGPASLGSAVYLFAMFYSLHTLITSVVPIEHGISSKP